jgi:hypothetical protein
MIEIPIVSSDVRSDLAGPLSPPFQVVPSTRETKLLQLPPFSLDALVRSLPFLPMQTAVLGKCMDGHPILFDLKDPRPGPILIVGDHASGKTSLLKTIAHSLILTNRSYEVDFNVITGQPQEWNVESSRYAAYFPTITSNYERSAGDAILNVCDLVESRQHGKRMGACRLVIIDGFETLPHMDFDVRLNFEWLLQEGPAYQVWPVVAVSTETAQKNQRWMNFFRTRVAGFISNQKVGRDLSLLREVDLSTMDAGRQFAVRVGRAAYQFWMPDSKY